MRASLALILYRLLLPLVFLAAFPGWIVKMLRRGGFGTHLPERTAIFTAALEYEPCGAVHLHAVSVGETMLALKLIREWRQREPLRSFVIATGTSTGHDVATAAGLVGVRVTYSPLDFPSMVRRYLDRFEPSRIVLVEGEVWPHLMRECRKHGIPVALVNARMSPRSARRFRKFAAWLRPFYSLLDTVALQEPSDAEIWQTLGVDPAAIHDTGSLKFDPGSGSRPQRRPEFQEILNAFGPDRPVVLAASSHPGEDAFIAHAIRIAAPHALPVIVPRHAERRAEVRAELERADFHVALRSAFPPSSPIATDRFRISHDDRSREGCPQSKFQPVLSKQQAETWTAGSVKPCGASSKKGIAFGDGNIQIGRSSAVLVIDSTGELRDWTAHADVVVIGKSFLSTGGQNPCEAILAGKPVIFGPHMENFQPLSRTLIAASACLQADDADQLAAAIRTALEPQKFAVMTRAASAILSRHEGATRRILDLLTR